MIRSSIPFRTRAGLGVISVLLLLLGYTALSWNQHRINPKDTTIPNWGQLADGVKKFTAANDRGERWIVEDVLATLGRLFLGLLLGVVLATILGILMGSVSWIEALLGPPLAFFAKIPPTASMAVFFVLFGTGQNMFSAMIAFGIAPTMAMSVFLSVRAIPDELIYKAYTVGASHLEVIWNVITPNVLPHIIDAIRLAIGPAMVFLIAAEMVVGEPGFGYRIRLEYKKLNMNVVYPYLVMLGMFGFAMDMAMRWLQRKCCPWFVRGSA